MAEARRPHAIAQYVAPLGIVIGLYLVVSARRELSFLTAPGPPSTSVRWDGDRLIAGIACLIIGVIAARSIIKARSGLKNEHA